MLTSFPGLHSFLAFSRLRNFGFSVLETICLSGSFGLKAFSQRVKTSVGLVLNFDLAINLFVTLVINNLPADA